MLYYYRVCRYDMTIDTNVDRCSKRPDEVLIIDLMGYRIIQWRKFDVHYTQTTLYLSQRQQRINFN